MSQIHLAPPNKKQGNKIYKSPSSFEEKALVRTGTGMLNGIYVVNKSASKVYLWVFDNTAASGTQLIPPLVLAATDGTASFDDMYGIPFGTGLYFAASSTLATYTATSASDLNLIVHYAVDVTSDLP